MTDRKLPMSLFGERLFSSALDHAKLETALSEIRPAGIPSEFAVQATVSLCAAQIAQALATARALEIGADPLPWAELSQPFKDQCRRFADGVVRFFLDSDQISFEAEAGACHAIAEWLQEPFTGDDVMAADIARRAISEYRARIRKALV